MAIRNIKGCVCNVTTFGGKMQKNAGLGFVSAARRARSLAAEMNGPTGNGLARHSFSVGKRNADGTITVLK